MCDTCGDNRFELIEKYKQILLDATNIGDSPEEMAVIDNILFRFWQMGWLKGELFGNTEQLEASHKKDHVADPNKMVEDSISRRAAIDALDKRFDSIPMEQTTEILQLRRDLRNLPSTQPETAKRIVGKSRDGITLWYQCDMCNEPVDEKDNFCRGCGRRLTDG